MKKIAFLIIIMVIATLLYSQQINKDIQKDNYELKSLSSKDLEDLSTLPVLKLPFTHKNKSLPAAVDNRTQIYFPPMFQQTGLSCGQVASVAYGFTYEICRLRNLDASNPDNNFPTHFPWNWENGGDGYLGVSYYHTLELLRLVGCPTTTEYGGAYSTGGGSRWLDGYDSYYAAMHNRIIGASQIKCDTEEGILTLKHWIDNHLEDSDVGGIGFFYSQYHYPSNTLPAGTPHEGERVIPSWGASPSHAMAIIGYDDNICWDYNGDGQYTNNIDLNGDGIIDVRDWEKGAFLMVNNYSNPYYAWMMYKSLADPTAQGGIWNNAVHVCHAKESHNVLLTYKVDMYYTKRGRIKILAGMSTDMDATSPDYYMEFPIINYQGGEIGLEGTNDEPGRQLEFGLDVTPLLNILSENTPARFFFQVIEDDDDNLGTGHINSFSLLDYTGETVSEIEYQYNNIDINNNDLTSIYIDYTPNYENVNITSNVLPIAETYNDYNFQMEADGGTPPYRWEFDTDYNLIEVTGAFPNDITTPVSSGSTINLPFDFDFYGETYNRILVSNSGYIDFSFEPYNLPYMHKLITAFMHRKCIAPFYQNMGASVYSNISEESVKIRWLSNNHVETAVVLHSNGEIEIYYRNINLAYDEVFVSGLSNGNQENFTIFPFSCSPEIPENLKIVLQANSLPEEFELSETGLLTGHPTTELLSYNLNFKVYDNSNLFDRKTIPISTDGLILNADLQTADNDSLEWGEQAWFDLTLRNTTDGEMTNMQLTLFCNNSEIVITDGVLNGFNLQPQEELTFDTGFEFESLYNFENGEIIPFQIEATCDQSSWIIDIEEPIYTAFLEDTDQYVDDNDNFRLDIDETADVHFMITNNGGSEIEDLEFSISSNDPFITINTGYYELESINHGSTKPTIFNITASSETPPGYIAEILMEIEAYNNYSTNLILRISIGEIVEDWESGTTDTFSWELTGAEDWYIVSDTVYEGQYSLKSGNITHNQTSELSIALEVLQTGEISFVRKVSCEDGAANNWDYLAFFIDNTEVIRWDGKIDWQEYSFPVSSGTHTFKWVYRKDGSVSSFDDCAWIDNIVFPPVYDAPKILTLSVDTIVKYMDTDEIDIDTIFITNSGGGILNYSLEVLNVLPTENNQNRSLADSYVSCSHEVFCQGDTANWTFTVFNGSPDNEWIKQAYMNFPFGVTVTEASDMVDQSNDTLFVSGTTGNGVIISWFNEDDNGWGMIHGNEYATCNVNAIIDENFTGDIEIGYQLHGDNYGSEPHMVNGIINLTNLGPPIDWFQIEPEQGNVIIGETDTVFVTFNTYGMSHGIYECLLKIYSDVDTVDVPVTLYVDWEVGINKDSFTMNIYPNPSSKTFYFDLKENTDTKLIIYDVLGKIHWINRTFGGIVEWTAPDDLKSGVYFIQIINSEGNSTYKLMLNR
jgi:hypothetical protein